MRKMNQMLALLQKKAARLDKKITSKEDALSLINAIGQNGNEYRKLYSMIETMRITSNIIFLTQEQLNILDSLSPKIMQSKINSALDLANNFLNKVHHEQRKAKLSNCSTVTMLTKMAGAGVAEQSIPDEVEQHNKVGKPDDVPENWEDLFTEEDDTENSYAFNLG